ncbi:hypothetical protein [Nostoc sp.]|uniref:hypothetical protein n=1 Tax=Nostoc sp. TaxID=1180 RepID=UPI002FF86FE4
MYPVEGVYRQLVLTALATAIYQVRMITYNRHSALQDIIHRHSRIFANNAQLLSINTGNYWGFVIAI